MPKNKIPLTFSIIMPVYKRREMVAEAINSILNQKNINNKIVEIIVVEDEKDSKVIVSNRDYYQKFSKNIRYIVNTNNEGPGGARQTGLAVAKGKYVVFLDSDDLLLPTYLQNIHNEISKGTSVAVLCLSRPFFDKGIKTVTKIKLKFLCLVRDFFICISYVFNNRRLYDGAFFLAQFSHMIFRRNVVKDIRFNYDYRRGAEDWDFFVKSLHMGKIEILCKRLLKFRYSCNSSTSNSLNLANKWKAYNTLLSRLPKNISSSFFVFLFKVYIYVFSKL